LAGTRVATEACGHVNVVKFSNKCRVYWT